MKITVLMGYKVKNNYLEMLMTLRSKRNECFDFHRNLKALVNYKLCGCENHCSYGLETI